MLSRFKELCVELNGLGVHYDENTKQLDFWRCLETMKEAEFASFVSREREDYRKKDRAARPSVDELIPTFIDKQTNMESDHKWNKLSMEQAQILSLMAKLENKKEKDTRKSEPRSNNEDTKYKPRPWRT